MRRLPDELIVVNANLLDKPLGVSRRRNRLERCAVLECWGRKLGIDAAHGVESRRFALGRLVAGET